MGYGMWYVQLRKRHINLNSEGIIGYAYHVSFFYVSKRFNVEWTLDGRGLFRL